MILWQKLELDIIQFLENQNSANTTETAKFFAKSYHTTMKTSTDPNNNLIVIKKPDILIKSWKQVFDVTQKSPKDLKSIPYNFIGKGMIEFWTGTIVSPLIPAAGMATGTLNTIIFPGNPLPVGIGIYNAFRKMKARLVAKELIKVYKDHIKTIQGTHIGIAPPPGSLPLVVPWSGLK